MTQVGMVMVSPSQDSFYCVSEQGVLSELGLGASAVLAHTLHEGKFLRVAVNGHAPDIQALVRDFPPKRETSEQGDLLRGLSVRLSLLRDSVTAELQLGEQAKFFPTDAALARWVAQAHQGRAMVVYD